MSSKIVVNISEPGDIVVPDTGGDVVVPDTGAFNMVSGGGTSVDVLPVVGLITVVLAIFAIVAVVISRIHNKNKLSFKTQDSYAGLHLRKNLLPKFAGLTVLILVFTFAVVELNSVQGGAEAFVFGGEEVDTLSITMEDVAINVEVEDKPAFGLGSTEITVNTATRSGYTLMAYVDSETTSLVKQDGDEDLAVKMLEEEEGSQGLMENTWGIALEAPINQYSPIFRGLPTTEEKAMVVNVSGTNPTPAGDKVTLYYGAYVTPDLGYGTYDGVTVNYVAVAHVITNEDVTIRYHGNGFYFDEEKTQDTNTVVYGETCELNYIGFSGGCSTIYVGDIEPIISKTPNVDDNGSAEEGYEDNLVYVDSVSFEGADMLRVEIMYGLESGYDYLYVFDGVRDGADGWYLKEKAITVVNGGDSRGRYNSGGMTTIYVEGDAVTFAFDSDSSERYYGYYAMVLPVYLEEPDNMEIFEDRLCRFIKSDNVDDDGELIWSYSDEYTIVEPINIPGADKIRIEMDYALTARTGEIVITEGVWNGNWDDMPDDMIYHDYYSNDENISGTEDFIIDGSVATFMMNTWGIPEEGYDYGFYARLYPVYDEEHEGTTTMQNCSFGRKSGEYKVPIIDDYDDYWYYTINIEGAPYFGERVWVDSEKEIMGYLMEYINLCAGKVFDVYAESFYEIVYEGNGGVLMEEFDYEHGNRQRIWSFGSESIWGNIYRNGNAFLEGWNTKPDGSGEWYQPGQQINSEGHEGEVLTLYAQWMI